MKPGWLKRSLERAHKQVMSRPLYMRPYELRECRMANRTSPTPAEAKAAPAESYPIVCVTWNDHHTLADTSWPVISSLVKDAREPMTCHTVGYLLDETDDYVLIAQTVTDDGTCSEVMKVLRPLVGDIKILKKAKVKK